MKVLLDVKNLTQDEIDVLWRIHAAMNEVDESARERLARQIRDDDFSAEAESVVDEAVASGAPPTIEDVRAKLREVQEQVGTVAPLNIMRKLGFKKASEIPSDKYPEVIRACMETLAAR